VRTISLLIAFAGAALAQPTSTPVTLSVVKVDVAPLAPPDLNSPYASPRDAARHRFRATLADLESGRDIKAAVRGFAEALALDRTYAAAAFNLGVMAALADQPADAAAAFQEAARLDPADLGARAVPQIERLRVVAALQKTSEGRRKLRYDAALYPVFQKLGKLPVAESMSTLGEIGRIDPRRWEAPALLAGLNGAGYGYDIAAKFLDIAISNAVDSGVKAALVKARAAAQRELDYAAARTVAEGAWDRGEYGKAAENYERAWAAIPSRAENGMEAAASWLAEDDTAQAARVLWRLRGSGDAGLVSSAAAMLEDLKPVEDAAASSLNQPSAAADRAPAEPVLIGSLLPAIDTSGMETLARPLPRLVEEIGQVVLLESLAADREDTGIAAQLPTLPPLRIAGEHPWSEIQALNPRRQPAKVTPRPIATVEVSGTARTRRFLNVTTRPEAASVFVDGNADPVCQTPCEIQLAAGDHSVRTVLAAFQTQEAQITLSAARQDLAWELNPERGSIIAESASGGNASASRPVTVLKVNGVEVAGTLPLELSLNPGLYRITTGSGSGANEQWVTVRPGAHLRLRF
jgi:hypothetical protein